MLIFYKSFVQKRRVRTSSIESMIFDSCTSFRSLRVRDLQKKHDLGDANIFYVVESHFQNSTGALGSFSSNVQFAGQLVKNWDGSSSPSSTEEELDAVVVTSAPV